MHWGGTGCWKSCVWGARARSLCWLGHAVPKGSPGQPSPRSLWVIPSQAGGRWKSRAWGVCLVNEPCMSPSKNAAFLLCFPLPFRQLGCVSCSSSVLGWWLSAGSASAAPLCSCSQLVHPCPVPQCYFSLCLLLLQTKRNGWYLL